MQKLRYIDLLPDEFEAKVAEAPIAYLPLGTLEWHGAHLPLGSDGMQSEGLFLDLAEAVGGVVLPMLFVAPDLTSEYNGVTYIGMDFYGRPQNESPRQMPGSAYWIPSPLFEQLLHQILLNLKRAGFMIVVAHGHGPSMRAWRDHTDEWSTETGLILMTAGSKEDRIGFQSDHAAANETSIMMHYHPDLVDLKKLDPDPSVFPEAILGADPRSHASPSFGDEIVKETSSRMIRELKALLAGLK